MTTTLLVRWYGFWLRVAFTLGLRKLTCKFMRRWKGEHKEKRTPVMLFESPEAIAAYISHYFQYRHDTIVLLLNKRRYVFPVDWVTDPEVMQTRLENCLVEDGDCDDIHFWAARALCTVPGVSEIYLLSSGFNGGAHATTVFKYFGEWKHIDYRLYDLHGDPMQATIDVALRCTKEGREHTISFWCFEKVTEDSWEPAVLCPDKLEA